MIDDLERYKNSPPFRGGVRGGVVLLGAAIVLAFVAGFFVVRPFKVVDAPVYSSGMYGKNFFDAAYDRVQETLPLEEGESEGESASALVAHHLLVADKIAEVFGVIASDDVRTVVIVSPNHFSIGSSAVQVFKGSWETPYGTVRADVDAIDALLAAVPELRHDEFAAPHEHGISALTPFVVRSFPHAIFVPIILDESLSADVAWRLGETIARELPDAVLIASVDMTHNRDADYTAENDAKVMAIIEKGENYETQLDIDSNASLRALFGFNQLRKTQAWHMTHHGSSLDMGATTDWRENTSHILGYFTE